MTTLRKRRFIYVSGSAQVATPHWISDNPLTAADSTAFAANDNFTAAAVLDTAGNRFSGATPWSGRLATTITNAQANAVLSLTLPQTASTVWQGYTQPLPASGNCIYRTMAHWDGHPTHQDLHSIGVVVEKGTGAARKTLIFVFGFNAAVGSECVRVDRYSTDADTFSTSPYSNSAPTYDTILAPWCVEIEYNSTNILFKYAMFNFAPMRTVLTEAEASWLGGRADRIGLVVLSGAAAGGNMRGHFLGFWRTA